MAKDKLNRTRSTMGGRSKPRKKSKSQPVREMHIRGTANKKFVVRHDYHPSAQGATPPSDEHGMGSLDELLAHVGEHGQNMTPEQPDPKQADMV